MNLYKDTNSNYAFPIILKVNKMENLKKILKLYSIEYRPIVSGNLIEHPFLKLYTSFSNKNVKKLHDGLYIGNNQFVRLENLAILDHIFNQVFK